MKCPICKQRVIWLDHIICSHCNIGWTLFEFIIDKVKFFVRAIAQIRKDEFLL